MTTDVQSYAFGRGESQAPMMLSGLDRLGEKLGRRIRALVEPICGVRPQVEAQDAPYPEMYDVIDRIVATREGESEGSREYLVKWRGLGYAAATWEATPRASPAAGAPETCAFYHHSCPAGGLGEEA